MNFNNMVNGENSMAGERVVENEVDQINDQRQRGGAYQQCENRSLEQIIYYV
jgi:hypothetical protein